MTQLFIFLLQSVWSAVVSIIALLLVAAVIGYFTSWIYAKSIYYPVIKSLETDKNELNSYITGLKDDWDKLNGKVEKLNDKISRLKEESVHKDKEIKKLSKSKKKMKQNA
jgi:peptidoglycan hydrolase CwlO-like protein